MSKTHTPLGGKLINKVLDSSKKDKAYKDAEKLPKILIEQDVSAMVEMIAIGSLSPLEGFMGEKDYQSVLHCKRLANGLPWTIPVTLAPTGEENAKVISKIKIGETIALVDAQSNKALALMHVTEKYGYSREERSTFTFGTAARKHPGVDYVYRRMGDVILAGPIELIEKQHWGLFEKYRLDPEDTWKLFFEERKWTTVAGFQTANPLHRGHEYLQKCAMEILDGLFIHPIVETTRKAYFRNEYRIKAYEIALKTYYPAHKVALAPLRVTMSYAGPREAIMHAIIRRNYGCTHFIVGRDHAGFGGYYDKYDAWKIFDTYEPGELGITPLFIKDSFYCTRCAAIATENTCPHGEEYQITMSGTAIQDILRYGYIPPKEVIRPEVAQIIIQGIQPKGTDEKGVATRPPGDTVKGLFPFYLTHHRLGGYPRGEKLDPAKLTLDDLDVALLDARINSDKVYDDVVKEIAYLFDIRRDLAERQRVEALEAAILRQKDLIAALEEKVADADENVPDQFMFQDKAESNRELEIAKQILADLERLVPTEEYKKRVWNPMPYEQYK